MLVTINCKRCKQEYSYDKVGRGNPKSYCPDCIKKQRAEYFKKYAGTEEGRKKHAKANAKYRGTKAARSAYYKYQFGISREQYLELLGKQNDVCKICKRPEDRMYRGKPTRLSVDHCHETGKVRGLLCRSCNIVLGRARHDIGVLDSMKAYLLDEDYFIDPNEDNTP